MGAWEETTGDGGGVEWRWENAYGTTIHAINSCALKLSKLTSATKVWRGFTGATLPRSFYVANEEGVKGGVEYGFMSTTVDRAQALHYAQGKASTVLEMEMGLVDRGADLSWLSQYAHEREILFPPLMGLQVLATRVRGRVLLAEIRLNLNMVSLTLEEVVSKRHKLVRDTCANVLASFKPASAEQRWARWATCGVEGWEAVAGRLLRVRLDAIKGEDSEYYNDDTRLGEAIGAIVAAAGSVECMMAAEMLPDAWSAFGDCVQLLDSENRSLDVIESAWVAGFANRMTIRTGGKGGNESLAVLGLLRMPRLQLLDLSQCMALTNLPSLEGLVGLETLQLSKCEMLVSLLSLEGLLKLHTMSLSSCTALRILPALEGLVGLRMLDLSHCTALTSLPSLAGLVGLQRLNVSFCSTLQSLPSLEGLVGLQKLDLSACYALHSLTSMEGLTGLQELDLSHSEALISLPSLEGAVKLQVLDLSHCDALTRIQSLEGLVGLETLKLSSCFALTRLPSLDGLVGLKTLKLSGCEALTSIPSLQGLESLHELDLSCCQALKTLPLSRWTALRGIFNHGLTVSQCLLLPRVERSLDPLDYCLYYVFSLLRLAFIVADRCCSVIIPVAIAYLVYHYFPSAKASIAMRLPWNYN